MNKTDLVNSVIENVHLERKNRERQQFLFPELNFDFLPRKSAERLVNSLIEIMKTRLEKGDNVNIFGFGRFDVEFKWARKGRNPKTGEKIRVPEKRLPFFKVGKELKQRVDF